MKKEYGRGFTLSDLLQQQESLNKLRAMVGLPNPFLPTATAEGAPKKEGVLRASVTAQFSGGGASGGGGGYPMTGPLWNAMAQQDGPAYTFVGFTPPGVLGGPQADYDDLVRGDGTVVRREYWPPSLPVRTWLPSDGPPPLPEPPAPEGRFQNLDWDDE